jgi:hypothetical protein
VPFKWKVTPRQSLKAMTDKYTKALFAAGNREAEQIAQEMEVWARANAPWTIDMWAPIFFHRLERLSRIQPVTLGEITPPE